MSGPERIAMLALCGWMAFACLRWMWLDWRAPLRGRTAFEQRQMGASFFGVARPRVIHTRLRTGPATAMTLLFVMVGAGLQLLRVHSHPAVYAVYGAAGAAALVWMSVALFNRPRWAVPPELRREPGMVHYGRDAPAPPFVDPRATPPTGERSREGDAR